MNPTAKTVVATLAALCILALPLRAQQAPVLKTAPMTRMERSDLLRTAPTHTFYLKYATDPNQENEIYTALRNALDADIKSFLVASQKAIIVRGLPDDIALVSQLLGELDRPHDAYRLTYTLTDFDGTRRLSSQHYVLAAMDGQLTTLKQGSKVSVSTGTYNVPSADVENQLAYVDVGLSFDATVSSVAGGATLKSRVEQSSLADDKPLPAGQNPMIQQTMLQGVYLVPLGKPTPLGTLDLPGTTHHLEIEVLLEKAP